MPISEDFDRSINLLTPANVSALLGWAKSHVRKFAENARHRKVDGWNETFGKDETYLALSRLLNLPGGREATEAICNRAKIRGLEEAVKANAKRVLVTLRGPELPGKASWARILAEGGASIEAAWVLWWDHGSDIDQSANGWIADYREVATLFEPLTVANAKPEARDVSSSEEDIRQTQDSLRKIRDDIFEWLADADGDATDLASQLRRAADRLDHLATDEHRARATKDKRVELAAVLSNYQTAVSQAAGSTTANTADILARIAVTGDEWPLSVIEQVIELAPSYIQAAQSWRSAMDRLSETHDYTGVAAAHEAERLLAKEIDLLLTALATDQPQTLSTEADDSEAASPAPEAAVQSSNIPDDAPEILVLGTPLLDEGAPSDTTSTVESEHAVVETIEGPAVEPIVDESDLIDLGGSANADIKSRRQQALRASATALARRRYGLATHISAVAEIDGEAPPFGFSSALLKALGAGLVVGTPGGSRGVALFSHARPGVEELLGDDDVDQPVRLVAFAGALRPALFAIASGANQVLLRLSGLQSLGPAIHGLSVFATNNVRNGDIVPAELAVVGDKMAPKLELEALQSATERFLAIADRRTIKFQPATAIWVSVLRKGPVHDALQAIIAGAPNAARLVDHALDSTLADIDRLITDRDREALGGRKREPLTAKPRATLRDWLKDVAARLESWRTLYRALQKSPLDRYNVESRDELKTRLEAASAELAAIDTQGNPALKLAIDVCHEAIAGVLDLFQGVNRPPLVTADEELLLFNSRIAIEDAGSWNEQKRFAFFVDAEELASRSPDFELALQSALQRGRFTQVDLLREKVVADDPTRDESLERKIRGERDRLLTQARSRLAKARSRLNELLGADDRQLLSRDLSPSLDELEIQVGDNTGSIDLADWNDTLSRIETQLDSGFNALVGPLQHEVSTLESTGQNVSELRKMIELGDLATLSEHIEAYKHGAVPPPSATNLLEAFNAHLQGQGRRIDLPSLERAIEARGQLDGVDFSGWEEGEIDTARSLLKAWRELKENEGNQSPPQLRAIFQALFAATAIDVTINKNPEVPGHYQLRTPVFTTREECVVPSFGSEAKGRYAVVLVDRRGIGSGVELATLKGKLSAPTFFVIRGSMPGAARKAFMQRVRSAGATPACGLIDEATILFLVMRRGWQRSDVFGLSLACGVVQPYSDTAQKTSPEMFFGRSGELRELWDPNGSCLVYGGRQLGKTALLRQIELRHNRPDQVVEYGDDEVEEFTRQGIQSFWRWIGNRAEARGIPMPSKRSAPEIQKAIRDWLEADVTRRLLFLIDEADKFLSSEMRSDFKMLLQLRELMRVTDRRCKFVFAGLHDVQRLARTPNSPLLHFGMPIRVGPLMGKDLFEARNMVEQPMAAAGYAFGANVEEGRALMGRALSEVGYYPSLMQTFGMVLVNRMNARAGSSIGGEPPELPIRISGSELNAALEDSAFRNNVRDKFDKTLDLDPRYRLIAYLVMIGTQKSANRDDMRPGMSIAAIQKEAMFWWPQGFVEDSSNSAFEGLLKEMEGLGVLVGLNDGRYAIRSARIAAMLGSVTEVEDRIQELADQSYEVVEDTGSLRRALGKASSPLTFRQEAVLMEHRNAPPVTLVLTSEALGLGLMPEAIAELTRTDEELLVVPFKSVDTISQLERAITTVASRTKEAGRQKGLLIASGPWLGREAVAAAFEHLEVRRAKRLSNRGKEQGVRVILLPSMIDWRELGDEDQGDRLWGAMLVSLSPLHDASLRAWLERRTGSRTVPPGAIEKLRLTTGGFPDVLADLVGDTAEQILAAAETARGTMLADPDKALASVGLGAVWLRQVSEFVLNQCDGAISVGDQESVIDLMRDEGLRDGDRALRVLGCLGLLDRTMDRDLLSGWQLNPLIAELLRSRPSA
ncbi:ATP-binding protein [Mesorhizobium sp. M1005]|uniref:ATP-binding protein n=1 Tax=unclassified Mesorhizobium TaxID=325217 RepID=UPI003339A61C